MHDTLRRPLLDIKSFVPDLEQEIAELAAEPARAPILVTREATHGPFPLTARIAQDLKEAYRYGPADLNAAQREALDMICTKMARIMSGDPNTLDHWDDIAGYAKLGAEACE